MIKPTNAFILIMTMAMIVTSAYVAGWLSGNAGQPITPVGEAQAAGGKVTDPKGTAPDRYVYYPGTERLAKDEVRVIACGTGMPEQRRGAASACFLFEFGNGEKMIFDLGSGSSRNINALMIPYEPLPRAAR